MERNDGTKWRSGPGGPRGREAGRAQHTAPWRVAVSGREMVASCAFRPGRQAARDGVGRAHARHATARATFPCTPSSPQNAKYECESAKRMKLFFDGLELKKLNELPAARWKDSQVTVVGKLHRADTAGEMTPIYMEVTSISAPNGASTH